MTATLRASIASRATASLTKLRAAWRRERGLVHARGILLAIACSATVVLANLALDRLLVLPGAARMALLAADAGVLGWIAWRSWWSRLRRWDPVRVALQVERLEPCLQTILVSHVQLVGDGEGSGSPRLIAALHERAERETESIDFRRIVDPRVLRPAAAAAALAVAVALGLAVPARATFLVFLERMLHPSSDASYPTRTRIDWTTGSLAVGEGSRVLLAARVSGEVPEEGDLEVRFPGTSWEALAARPGAAAGEFTAAVERAMRSFEYRFTIGDARSAASRVEVIPPPRIASGRVRVAFPPYTGMEPRDLDSLNVDVVEDGVVEWEVRCDRPVTAGEVVREPGAAIALDIDRSDPRIARARIAAASSFAYRFRWTHGRGLVHDGTVSYAVKVIPDAMPTIEVLRPDPEEKGTVQKEIEIAFRATDDFGLGDATIVFAVDEGPEVRHPLGSLRGRPPDAPFEARWRPLESLPGLKEGDQVRYRIEVADNRAPLPNLGRSPVLRLAVVGVDEYLRSISERRARLTTRIGGILRDEDEGSKSVKTIEDMAR